MFFSIMVQAPRLELGQVAPPDPKSGASANSAMPAHKYSNTQILLYVWLNGSTFVACFLLLPKITMKFKIA
jgi:hypothetical protein